MENSNVEESIPVVGNEDLQVSDPAPEVAAGDENELENGGGVDEHEGTTVVFGGEGEFRAKRKRGRPRKQPVEMRQEFMAMTQSSATTEKRGRGRPRGSGKWQTLAASLGGYNARDTGGSNFTPHIIAIQEGENIVERIWSFSQMTPDAICILSASGSISSAEVYVPSSRGGVVRYEGQLSIVFLNGSHTYCEKRDGKTCLLSVQLAYPDGRLRGGAVAGSLIAAGPTQLTIGTFRQKVMKQQVRMLYLGSPTVAKTPVEGENCEVRQVLATAERADEVNLNGPAPAALPLDWNAFQPSASAF